MDRSMEVYTVEEFRSDSVAWGCELSSLQTEQFLRYSVLLREWNERVNLTAIVDEREVLIKHFLDSLSVVPLLETWDSGCRVLDVGSGAGLPGLALKIACPDLPVMLCDSLRKRVEFLRLVIEDLGLEGVEAVHGRAEDLARSELFRDGFSHVVARAVARLSVLVEWCMPFVRPGGRFLALKGPSTGEELKDAAPAIGALRGRLVGVHEFSLPYGEGGRSIVVLDKVAPTPRRFPRRPGEAQRKPL